jgi:hypothetical protein
MLIPFDINNNEIKNLDDKRLINLKKKLPLRDKNTDRDKIGFKLEAIMDDDEKLDCFTEMNEPSLSQNSLKRKEEDTRNLLEVILVLGK